MYLHLTSVHPTSKQVFFFQFTFFNVNIMAVRFGRSIMFRKIMLQNPAWFRKSLIHTSTIADPPRVLITGKWNCKVFRVYIWYIQNMCYVLTITKLTNKAFDEKDSSSQSPGLKISSKNIVSRRHQLLYKKIRDSQRLELYANCLHKTTHLELLKKSKKLKFNFLPPSALFECLT